MSTINVDTINEYTSAGGVTIDSVTIKDGKITSSNATGLTLINRTSFTDSASVTTDNVFTTTYDFYKIILNVKITDGGSATLGRFRLRTGGASGSDYSSSNTYVQHYEYMPLGSSTADTHSGENATNYFTLGSFGTQSSNWEIFIGNPMISGVNTHAHYKGTMTQSGTDYAYTGYGVLDVYDQITGVSYFSSDNSTISGSVSVYGYGK